MSLGIREDRDAEEEIYAWRDRREVVATYYRWRLQWRIRAKIISS
jgi:hypothetical protein